MLNLFLIKRGPRPSHHRAPFHPVILCDKLSVARWQAGHTGDRACVWKRQGLRDNGFGWLMTRWNGLDIDYGPVVHTVELPDGLKPAFCRDYVDWPMVVRDLLPGAVWWSQKVL